MKFKIINGKIVDPSQKLDHVVKTIYVNDGIVVNPKKEEIKDYIKTYDAKNMVVMAGGIDIHSHIAGGNVNNARLLMPEIHKKFVSHLLKNRNHLIGIRRWIQFGFFSHISRHNLFISKS